MVKTGAKYFFCGVVSLLLTGFFSAAQVVFSTKVSSRSITRNDLLELSYEAENGTIESLPTPAFTGWQLVSGPNFSSSITTINGNSSTRTAYQFVLKPNAPGVLTVPGVTATINGRSVSCTALVINVEKAGAAGGNAGRSGRSSAVLNRADAIPNPGFFEDDYDGYVLRGGEDAQKKIAENLFLQVNVSKQSCYEGEPLVAEYKLFSRVSLNANVTRRPSFSGFGSVDMKDGSNSDYEITRLNNKLYKVYKVRRVQLFPLQSGTQTLEPVEIEAKVQFRNIPSYANMNRYDPYSPDNFVTIPYLVRSKPISIEVKALPAEGRPVSFSGTVGRFEMVSKMKTQKLARQQTGNLDIEISGLGNWAMVPEPDIAWPPGVEVFEPVITESLDSQAIPLSGKRIYSYSFTTNIPGKLQIPGVSFGFFDPWKERYDTAGTVPPPVEVSANVLPAPKIEADAEGYTDYTSLFTDVITIVAPIATMGLVVVLALRNRRRRLRAFEAEEWPLLQEVVAPEPAGKFTGSGSGQKQNTPPEAWMPPELKTHTPSPGAVVPAPPVTHTPPPEQSLKSLLASAKKDISHHLQYKWHFKQGENLLGQLEKRGLAAGELELIAELLLDIDDQLYNPVAEPGDAGLFKSRIDQVWQILKA